MKKQELIHLHGLLSEVGNYLEEEGYNINLDGYEEPGVRPTSIHKSKTDHKEAVFAMADAITSEISEMYDEDQSVGSLLDDRNADD